MMMGILADKTPSGGTVLFDTALMSGSGNSGVTLDTFNAGAHAFNFNVGSGSNGTTNRALLVALYFAGANAGTSSNPSVTWNGVAMTLIGGPYSNGTTGDIYFFGLANPDTGANSLAATWTGSNQVLVAALSVVAADQTGGTTTFRNATSATGSGTSLSVAVTSATGEIVMGAFESGGNFSAEGNIDIGRDNTANVFAVAANRAAGAASVNLTATAGSGTWVAAGVSIKAA